MISDIDKIAGNRPINKMVVTSVLEESLKEDDNFNSESFDKLLKLGFKDDEALILLASHKSLIKYGYRMSLDTLRYINSLYQGNSRFSPVKDLIRSPFLFAKTGWICEHAPWFVFYNRYKQDELDSYILQFAERYQSLFLANRASFDIQKKLTNPRRLLATSFWEKEVLDPVEIILWATRNNLEGVELSVDYHPFNYAKLLPEEFSKEKREEIRDKSCCLTPWNKD